MFVKGKVIVFRMIFWYNEGNKNYLEVNWMKGNNILFLLCYFSIFFVLFLLLIIVYFVVEDEVKYYVKKVFWLYVFLYVILFGGLVVLGMYGLGFN